jgi:DNA-directed RNA polymerase specialized sigma subunit
MPRGTNDPVAAIMQRRDVDDTLAQLERKQGELVALVREFEVIVDAIEDRRLQIIIRCYFGLGWTDEQIADQLELSRQHVNRLRLAYLEDLDGGNGNGRTTETE